MHFTACTFLVFLGGCLLSSTPRLQLAIIGAKVCKFCSQNYGMLEPPTTLTRLACIVKSRGDAMGIRKPLLFPPVKDQGSTTIWSC